MSEYQYYEFQAIDHPLDEEAQARLRGLSSRADITSTSFVNVYNYGDFRGDPKKLMEEYFDAFLYVANWGTHRLMLRLPRGLFDVAAATNYCGGQGLSLWTTDEHVILEFVVNDEMGERSGWEEGEGWLASLIPLRAELLTGDLRCLYIGWLSSVLMGDLEEDEPEPPVPPGLRQLSRAQQRLAEFLWVDSDLLEVAAEQDPGGLPAEPSPAALAGWVKSLPEGDKDTLLLRIIRDDARHLRHELLQRFRQAKAATPPAKGKAAPAAPARRSVGELLAAMERRAEENRRLAAEAKALEKERLARENAKKRAQYLDTLQGREADLWRQVEKLIEAKKAKEYDQAVELLKDLRDLGARAGHEEPFTQRMRSLRERHHTKHSLLKRFTAAGLPA